MIKLYDLNDQTRDLLSALTESEVACLLDMATSAMYEIEMRTPRVHLGENSCVELAMRTILFLHGKGTED